MIQARGIAVQQFTDGGWKCGVAAVILREVADGVPRNGSGYGAVLRANNPK